MNPTIARVWIISASLGCGLFMNSCGNVSEKNSAPDDPTIVAVYDGGSVTREEIDAAILTKKPEARRPDSDDVAGWYETIIEDIVIERLLWADPKIDSESIEQELAVFRLEELHRKTVEAFLEDRVPATEPISPSEAQDFFDKHKEQWVQKGRREVYNIFLRKGGRNRDRSLDEVAAEIRGRFARGESFASLALEFSDSESRHQGGLIGWLESGQIAPQIASVVFSLDEGELSSPLAASQGLHLFLVAGIVEEQLFSFAEARPQIEKRLIADRREERVEKLAQGLPEVPYTFVATGEDLKALMQNAAPKTPVLRVGEYRMDVGRLREMVALSISDGQPATSELPGRILDLTERRERIFAEASKLGLENDPVVERYLESTMQTSRLKLRRQRVIERMVDGDSERMQAWYEENQKRFSTPLRLNTTRLVISLNPTTAGEVMKSLEALSQSGAAEDGLNRVAAQFDGRVDIVGWKTLSELAAIRPVAARLASNLTIGQVSPPFRTTDTLEVLLVTDRQEPETQPFTAVYDRVRLEYLRSHAAEIFGRWVTAEFDRIGLRVFPDRLHGTVG